MDMRELMIEKEEEYDELRAYEFDEQFRFWINRNIILSEKDVQDFIDSFIFKDKEKWIEEECLTHVADLTAHTHDQEKERRRGI